jgi:hypothetical protein
MVTSKETAMFLREGAGNVAAPPAPPPIPVDYRQGSPDALERKQASNNTPLQPPTPSGGGSQSVPGAAIAKAATPPVQTAVLAPTAPTAPTDPKAAAAQQQLVTDVQRAPERDRGLVLAQGLVALSDQYGDVAAAQAYGQLAKADPKVAAQATTNFYLAEATPLDRAEYLDPTHTPEGMEATRKLFIERKDDVHRLMAAGQNEIGKLDAPTVRAFSAELSQQAGRTSQPEVFNGIARDVSASGSEALQRSFSQEAMAYASTALGKDGDVQRGTWPDYLSMVGQAAKDSPSAARDIFNFTQSHSMGSAKAGNAALEVTLQAFASNGSTETLVGRANNSRLTPSYLPFMDALMAPGAAQGPMNASDALRVFETVCNSNEDMLGVSLLEQGDKKGGSKGTAQMADLYTRYMPQWVTPQFTALPQGGYAQGPSLIAGTTTGTLNDRFDKCFSNFMREAMFDPKEGGPYRQKLLNDQLAFINDMANGKVGSTMSSEARGRLTGNLVGLINQGFDKYAGDVRSDGETKKAMANFAIGLGFAFIPGPEGKVAKILMSQGLGQGKGLVEDAVAELVDAGVKRDIAKGAVDAARSGDMLTAFQKLNLQGEGPQRVLEYVNQQRGSFESGNLSMGELMRQVFGDAKVTGNIDFANGLQSGWDQIQDRSSPPG